MKSKYEQLEFHLRTVPEEVNEITLSLQQLEVIIVNKLPESHTATVLGGQISLKTGTGLRRMPGQMQVTLYPRLTRIEIAVGFASSASLLIQRHGSYP